VVVRRALDQARRLESLADDLLDLSRIEAMSGDVHPEPVDVIALAHEIGEVYASRAEQQDIDFTLEMPSEALIVNGCPSQIQRLMSNLLDNAVKFTPAGGSVQFSLARVDRSVELIVQDTGIGILPDDLPFLFERFRRGRNTANYPGSGLGLAIVKAIADAHNGTAHVASWASGTRVTVSLPVAEDKHPARENEPLR
jgi:signal transduction histidine kinase